MFENRASFKDLVGYESVIKELKYIIYSLSKCKEKQTYMSPLPNGILIYGYSGMGKTLLMRSIENEALVPVYSLYASSMPLDDEDAMKEKVNNAFDKAIKTEPSILLIDDLDRFMDDPDLAGASKTFKYRLIDLWDNKMSSHTVLPIATTSKTDVSDLVDRTGRFERHYSLPRHGAHNRIELMNHLINQLGFKVEPTLDRVNHLYLYDSPGNIRHQLILAMQIAIKNTNKSIIREKDFLEARERTKTGMRTAESRMLSSEIWRTAIHEAGHTVASYASLFKETFVQASILPTVYSSGHTSYGIDGLLEQDDTKDTYNDLLMRLLAGAYAEKIFFSQHSNGSSDDIKRATTVASQMVYEYGMSDLGLRNYTGDTSYGDSFSLSPSMKMKVDEQINELLGNAEERVECVLAANKDLVESIANDLFERKILFKEDINVLVQKIGLVIPS